MVKAARSSSAASTPVKVETFRTHTLFVDAERKYSDEEIAANAEFEEDSEDAAVSHSWMLRLKVDEDAYSLTVERGFRRRTRILLPVETHAFHFGAEEWGAFVLAIERLDRELSEHHLREQSEGPLASLIAQGVLVEQPTKAPRRAGRSRNAR